MAEPLRDPPSVFREADDLLARGEPAKACRLLLQVAEECRFREEWHDRMGRCYWEMTQVKPVDDQGRLVGNPPGEWQRSLQLLAGRHWFLSSRDDAPSRQARALLLDRRVVA